MKILDENGRIGGKISIIDVIVILLCLLLVLGVYVKYSDQDSRSKSMETKKITYTVKIERIRQGTVDAIRKGDHFLESQNKNDVGKVVAIDVKPAESLMTMDDGSMVETEVPERYDVVLTLEKEAEFNDGHVYVNNVDELTVNSSITLLSKYAQFTGEITGIDK